MDGVVFSNDTVIDFINRSFVSVKMQMDKTSSDGENTRNWYAVADSIDKAYPVRAYPAYLFLSSDGAMLHKGLGAMGVQAFLALANDAMDPQQQYYNRLALYKRGNLSIELQPELARTARNLNDDSVAKAVALDYIHGHLEKLNEAALWTRDNLEFINSFQGVITSQDILFKKYVKQKQEIDSIMGVKGFADKLVNSIVKAEEINAPVEAGIRNRVEPNWVEIEKTIEKKYHKSYYYDVLKGRVKYYKSMKEWAKYSTYFVRQMNFIKIETFSKEAALMINNSAAEVFQYSENRRELEYALSWIDHAISLHPETDPNELDTKANILYKLHRVKEALLLEQQSAKLAPDDQEIQDAYTKMTKNLPTWPTNL